MQAAVQQFLGGANVLDPSQKQQIIALLHQELNRRGLLQRDVKLKQQELNKITAELKNKRQILDSLPDQLAVLERASKPMQKFFSHAASNNTTEDSLRMIGTERSTRLEHARSLPTPLYTLFQQLQQYVDQTTSPSLSSSLSASFPLVS
jgi:ABC-type transporter Mla subunit MlaD